MQRKNKVQSPKTAQPATQAPYLVRYFDGCVKSQPFFSQTDAEKFYAALPVATEDKTMVDVGANKVLL